MRKSHLASEMRQASPAKKPVQVNHAQKVINAFSEVIKEAVISGNTVFIRGFGTFGTKLRQSRKARDINKNELISLPAHVLPSFTPSRDFKKQVRKAHK